MSENEKDVEKSFISFKKQLINKIGKKALYNDEIDEAGRKLIGPKFKGVCSHDKLPLKPGYYIVNTGNSKSAGIHWIAVVCTPKTIYIYDSFARHHGTILKSIEKKAKAKKMKIVNSDRSDLEQKDDTSICGQLSIAWLLCVKKYGIRKALLI